MKKLSLLLIFSALTATFAFSTAATEQNPTVRIGLFYGSEALSSAKLENEVGSGYSFGFFDSTRNFISLFDVKSTKLTMISDKNYDYAKDTYYTTAPVSSTMVGAYHLEGSKVYSYNKTEITAEITRLKGLGIKAFPVLYGTGIRIRAGSYTSLSAAQSAVSSHASTFSGQTLTAVGSSSTCITVTDTATGEILYESDSTAASLAIMPQASSGVKVVTWFKGYRRYGGFEYRRGGGNLTVINVLSVQDYVKGVTPYEINPNWSIEAQKAMAVCARSYAVGNRNKHSSLGFDVCDTTCCQVYYGLNAATSLSDKAVDDTLGLYMYYNGSLATAYYHSSNGGYTENSENVWGSVIGYLRAVPDNFEDLSKASNGIWQKPITLAQMTSILSSKGYANSGITDAYISQFTEAGNVYALTFKDSSNKEFTFRRENARLILSSYTLSQRYIIDYMLPVYINTSTTLLTTSLNNTYAIGAGSKLSRLSPGSGAISVLTKNGLSTLSESNMSYVINGRGWGHNVGMSQYGCKGMAERGYTCEQILKYYYTGVTVGN